MGEVVVTVLGENFISKAVEVSNFQFVFLGFEMWLFVCGVM
jgi:hypothetical protein